MHYIYQQVIEQLGINVELFLQKLETGLCKKSLSKRDQEIICRFLLGYRRKQIAEAINISDGEVGNQLNTNIYPRIAELMQLDQGEVANNWVLILNFLLHPSNGYRLNPALQLNSDNFQGSFGRQIFLYPSNQKIVQDQIKGTQRYQQGLYYQALLLFSKAWNEEQKIYGRGNPEVAIYINNCLIEYQKPLLQKQGVRVYNLAVVVPFHHNQGRIAAEILRGIAQIQSQINFRNFDLTELEMEFCQFTEEDEDGNTRKTNNSKSKIISPNLFSSLNSKDNPITFGGIALRIMIVNDPNNIYNPYNQTAEKLASLASQLNLIAVIGHYSSEMTQTALSFYSGKGIALVNASSTSNDLSRLDESIGFFRITTQDSINAERLVRYLAGSFADAQPRKVSIIYNENSSYSCSYRSAVKKCLTQYPIQLELQSEYGQIGGSFQEIQAYIAAIRQENIDVIILIPDGGIESNSLNNAGLISRLNLKKCIIAGSATFYQENVLHWMHERSQWNLEDSDDCQLIACIPWHWHSQENGCDSPNLLARQFCQIGAQLWGKENLTWRSATAFDSIFVILKALERYQESESLLIQMRRYFKVQGKELRGVTGTIKFSQNGDRVSPPTEIVAVKQIKRAADTEHEQKRNGLEKQWQWTPVKLKSE